MIKENALDKDTADFLDALSPRDQSEALTYYGQPDHTSLVFDLHYGLSKLQNAGSVFISNFSVISAETANASVKGLVDKIKNDNLNKVFCAATVPASGRNEFASGHSVALAIDGEQKLIIYQDPWGTPPPGYLVSALQENLAGYEQSHLNVPQQKDIYSCALITAMNLVSMAQGDSIDPTIDDKLWDLRRAHAPLLLAKRKECIEQSRQKTLESLQNDGEIVKKASGRFSMTINNRQNLEAADKLLAAIDDLDPTYPKLTPSLRLLIRLTRT